MKNEFNLSEKIDEVEAGPLGYAPQSILYKQDVKEFIRLLKEEISKTFQKWEIDSLVQEEELDKIDKLAGEELK